MTDAEKISTAVKMLKNRLYWLEIQLEKVSALINTGDHKSFDIGVLAEKREKLNRERMRIEILLDVLDRNYFSEDIMPLFDGRWEKECWT